jgi:FKBP-type peptidyl-prolyl cis-trans isomerase SlyD
MRRRVRYRGPMKVAADLVVSIEYTLKNDAGEVLDGSDEDGPLHYLHGHDNIVPGLEAALNGRALGDSLNVTVAPEDGYGTPDDDLVFEVPREELSDDIEPEVGMELGMTSDDGDFLRARICGVTTDTVQLDANHELAGQTLHFAVKVVGIRQPTQEELEHGHVHDPSDPHHH